MGLKSQNPFLRISMTIWLSGESYTNARSQLSSQDKNNSQEIAFCDLA
jgi:hypothetical protein